ncbi:DNA-directed RNA polymerase sigma-70 factor (plasmid) [Fulvitalea axinellae]|uniref:DNA-directed RNA polymerase sigma-70 factor n=1 Tax=Fulvitalea axinellae TaxID=1182444 RepID=A0AAU9DBR1_9BACT|nr:DNA-directed RNA polymerase sigma-70 factor [Fulvitalea axinellae]
MTAVLCRHFGLKHIEIAEDIASDTFLKASEHWAINGIPDNPTAWLYTVAKNKTKDYLKHTSVFDTKVRPLLDSDDDALPIDFEINPEIISDSQLAMIFATCDPNNSVESQICLTLQVLCGFSVEEIANAFLLKKETIKKRLHRARLNLRNSDFQIKTLCEKDIRSRMVVVLRSIYLLFNEGYFSKTNNRLVRKNLCAEALRLALVLTENELTNTPQTNALMALMCYQSSRLETRTDTQGEAILFEEQNRDLWDQELIEKGNYYLVEACTGNERSKYHLEAGIAYWHTTPTDENKWRHILHLYNQLILIEYSPVTALNRIFALSKVYGKTKAVLEVEKLKLTDIGYYHELLGYLYSEDNPAKAIHHYQKAIGLTKSKIEQHTLKKEINRLSEKNR